MAGPARPAPLAPLHLRMVMQMQEEALAQRQTHFHQAAASRAAAAAAGVCLAVPVRMAGMAALVRQQQAPTAVRALNPAAVAVVAVGTAAAPR